MATEIAYNLRGYRKLIKVYDWYEVWERDVYGAQGWHRVHRGFSIATAIAKLEASSLLLPLKRNQYEKVC